MTQEEKIYTICIALYPHINEDSKQSMMEVCLKAEITIESSAELRRLARKMKDEDLAKVVESKDDDIYIELDHRGITLCEIGINVNQIRNAVSTDLSIPNNVVENILQILHRIEKEMIGLRFNPTSPNDIISAAANYSTIASFAFTLVELFAKAFR